MSRQRNVIAVRDEKRSRPWDVRFVLVDRDSGELVDDAGGWGYRTTDRAYSAWRRHNRVPAGHSRELAARQAVRRFRTLHGDFMERLNGRIRQGGCTVDVVGNMLREAGFADPGFTAAELLRFGLS